MKYDLTRWNRAGLKKFRYIDDNAATMLEALRQDLRDRFPAWAGLAVAVSADETTAQRNQRLEQQYTRVVREWGWEVTRTFSRAAHLLTEHMDAYANEGYLRTAGQWENVRRLVEMIGYHPAPPASASTPIVLLTKPGQSGLVARGFQINYTPKTGAPVLFETLDDLAVAAEFNEMRLNGWNRSSAAMAGVVWQLGEKQEVSAGALAILHNEKTADSFVVHVSAVDATRRLMLSPAHTGDSWSNWQQGEALLLFDPAKIHKPRLNGSDVVHLPAGHGLLAGDLIAWQSGGTWHYDTVEESDSQAVKFSGSSPAVASGLFRVQTIKADSSGKLLFPASGGYQSKSISKSGSANWPASMVVIPRTTPDNSYGVSGSYSEVAASATIDTMYLVPQGSAAVVVQAASASAGFVFPGNPGTLTSGDLVIGELTNGSCQALKVAAVSKRDDAYTLTFVTTPTGALARLYGPFKETLRPLDYNVNTVSLPDPLLIELPASGRLPKELTVGKRLLLEQLGAAGDLVAAHSARIASVNETTGELFLDRFPTAASGFTRGNTVVRGNVVLAGHGETKPARVLGSGDATRSYQQFVLKEKQISFVAAANQASGVAAAIEIRVAGQKWDQQATLDDSEPAAADYTVHLTEDGYLLIGFGDGVHGRRLPTGTSNVMVTFRTGAGLAGNVPVNSLVKPVKPHVLIDTVRQPLAATGGNDREAIESLRSNAPAALFTLGRAVSLDDYARLAERNAGVWQARAFRLANQGAQQEQIQVVVVPAGGGALGELTTDLQDFIEANDLPGATVNIVNHLPLAFGLSITVQVERAHYVPQQVAAQVRQALLSAFSLQKRRLGEPLFVSEIYQVVEGVPGVANSDCLISTGNLASVSPAPMVRRSSGGVIRLIQPQPDQVLILDEQLSSLTVQTKEFVL